MNRIASQLLAVLVIVLATLGFAYTARASHSSCSPFSTVVTNYPVTGGNLSGNVCASWGQTTWLVTAHTFAPQSYVISTWIGGYETCGTTWTLTLNGGYKDTYNATVGPGNKPVGPFLNCQPWQTQRYQAAGSFYRKQSSGSAWEGTTGNKIY